MRKNINYVVDADIKAFFNNVNHEWLVKFLELTIQDQKFIRYIIRILKAGVMENMQYQESDKGTPQRRTNIANISKCIFALCARLMV